MLARGMEPGSRPSFQPAGAGALLVSVIVIGVGIGVLGGWAAGSVGYGALVGAIVKFAKEKQARLLWCNARVTAADFYRKLGFEIVSDEFDIPNIGPHYLMKLDLVALLKSYGIAGGDFRLLGQPEQAYLPGFRAVAVG